MKAIHNYRASFLLLMLALLNSCGKANDQNSVSIEFISASPNTITLKGTGGAGLSDKSELQFRVTDPFGILLDAQTVAFNLSTNVGGITLSSSSAVSDSNGLVSTIVQSGSVPTAVRVIARIPGTDITTQSDQLSISSGIPDQDSFSMSSAVFNPEALNFDNVEVNINVRLGDIFNNFVPPGTTIKFLTEGGAIEGECLTGAQSGCTVKWISGEPRPADGRVTILATALGQENFIDNNGNGLFDEGDTFTDLPEAFINNNENGGVNENAIYDSGEFFFDLNDDGLYSTGDGSYSGSSCMPDYALCSEQKNVHIRAALVIVMSGSYAAISGLPDEMNLSTVPSNFTLTLSDELGNSLPGNTVISLETTNGSIESDTSFTVPNTLSPINIPVSILADETSDTGTFTIKVTTPQNVFSIFTTTAND